MAHEISHRNAPHGSHYITQQIMGKLYEPLRDSQPADYGNHGDYLPEAGRLNDSLEDSQPNIFRMVIRVLLEPAKKKRNNISPKEPKTPQREPQGYII